MVSCNICYDLDRVAIPQPHKNKYMRSLGPGPNRYTLGSDNLRESASRGCRTCSVLRDAVETMMKEGGLIKAAQLPKYHVAIWDKDDGGTGSQSLRVLLECDLGDEDYRRFEVELFTPPNGSCYQIYY